MNYTFTIPGRLPGMNEIVAAAKGMGGRGFGYARMKKKAMADVVLCLPSSSSGPIFAPVALMIDWYEPNRKRDPDNIRAGVKFILDAMVLRGMLSDDSRARVASIQDRFHVDAADPRIVVEVYEINL